MRLIDADKLYKSIAELEEKTRKRLLEIDNKENPLEWVDTSASLREISLLKYTIADAATIEKRKTGEWTEVQCFFGGCSAICSVCGETVEGLTVERDIWFSYKLHAYCPCCGASMDERTKQWIKMKF